MRYRSTKDHIWYLGDEKGPGTSNITVYPYSKLIRKGNRLLVDGVLSEEIEPWSLLDQHIELDEVTNVQQILENYGE